ncbi:MAG: hypothetical protein QM760_04305 [Nibricoccus sp.]
MKRIAKREVSVPADDSGNSVIARIFFGVMSLAILATILRPVLTGCYRGKAGTGIIYRDSEPALFWMMIGATVLVAGMFAYLAFRNKQSSLK